MLQNQGVDRLYCSYMALFQRVPTQYKQNLPYSISFTTKTKLIIGLGNPGKSYDLTRHNAGFNAVDAFAKSNDFAGYVDNKKFKGLVSEKTIGPAKVILLKSNTYMNLSGESAQAVANFYKIDLSDIVAVYDEVSIPFGQIRTRIGGQSAGHNGIKSLIEHLEPNFSRIRIGIKNAITPKAETSDFVLGKFTKEEQPHIVDINNEVSGILTEFIYGENLPIDTRKIIL